MSVKHMTMLVLAPILMSISGSGLVGQAHEHDQPYAGLDMREIKALSADEVASLLDGAGMSFALAAELNGYPGPRHVLELASELELTPDQELSTREIFDAMQAEARELGARLVDQERELDESFQSRLLDRPGLDAHLTAISATRARLRGVHLAAHLELVEVLTEHQSRAYARLRGYGEQGSSHGTVGLLAPAPPDRARAPR